MTTTTATGKTGVSVELVPISEVPGLVERIVAITDPEFPAQLQAHRDKIESGELEVGVQFVGNKMKSVPSPTQYLIQRLEDKLTQINRPLNKKRWQGFRDTILEGGWWTAPDPITITDTGQIINGQHRLRAALSVQAGEDLGPDTVEPEFVVVWGVEAKAAVIMDEARRTANDRRAIAVSLMENIA